MLRRLWPYLKALRGRMVVAIICMSGVAGISTGLMWLMKYLFDHALAEKDMQALLIGIALVLFGFFLKSILWYAHSYLSAYVGQKIANRIRDAAYRHLYSLSMGFFDEKTSGHIMARLTNDVNTLQLMLAAAPTTVVRDGLTIVGLVGFVFYLNWQFALVSFTIFPVAALILVSLGRKSRRAGRESQERMASLFDTIKEAVSAMPIVQTFQNEQKEVDRFARENLNYFNVIMRLARINARSSPIMEALGAVVLAALLGFGGYGVIQGTWTLGAFVAFVGAAMSLYHPIKKFASLNVQMQLGLASAERVFQLLDQQPRVVEKASPVNLPPLRSGIAFRDVGFHYNAANPVLSGVSLTIHKGEAVALVGSSGSGKTTLAQLLLRFYDPTAGAILFDGVDLRDAAIASLRRQIAIVTQETHLFNDTVFSNIAYGRPGASREEIEAAARAAFAHDFIVGMPGGYEAVIGERGARLSGGERQRIAIARSLLKDPAILVLDEATSALDAESEKAVQAALDRLLEGRTVLMIAHRLSTVRKADRIVVLESGRIKECGTHDELLAHQGRYHDLYHLQATF